MQGKNLLDAVVFPHQPCAVGGGVEQRDVRAEHERVRMCVKGQRGGRQAKGIGQRTRAREQPAVAEMHAVEKAQRENTGSVHCQTSKKLLIVRTVPFSAAARARNSPFWP